MEGLDSTRTDWRAKKRNQAQATLPASVVWKQRGMTTAMAANPPARKKDRTRRDNRQERQERQEARTKMDEVDVGEG